jgi:hypothetical protein
MTTGWMGWIKFNAVGGIGIVVQLGTLTLLVVRRNQGKGEHVGGPFRPPQGRRRAAQNSTLAAANDLTPLASLCWGAPKGRPYTWGRDQSRAGTAFDFIETTPTTRDPQQYASPLMPEFAGWPAMRVRKIRRRC